MPLSRHPLALFCLACGLSASFINAAPGWTEVTQAAGLGGHQSSRLKFVDLNSDTRSDAVILAESAGGAQPLVFLNLSEQAGDSRLSFHYEPVEDTGLPNLQIGDVLVFSDLDNDGHADAILGRYLDIYQDDYSPPAQGPLRTSWFPGQGDGTFGAPIPFDAATLGTTRALAVNDINRDGRLDLFVGNWYQRYFTGYESFRNDVLLQYPDADDRPAFARWPLPLETAPTNYRSDTGGRPTYGAGIVALDDGLPYLVELNYGRRWNRLYQLAEPKRLLKPDSSEEDWNANPFATLREPQALGQHLIRQLAGRDIAPEAGVDGDSIRHGRHPSWPEELTRSRPRAKRSDEPPFRANGNTFDLAVGDIDNDGDFDLFFSTIIHAWAGESSDRSRFLVNQLKETGALRFESFKRLSVDRLPASPAPGEPLQPHHTTEQNQGDIYSELADLNNDGRLDLLICSSDYADESPYDERLRLFYQQADGRYRDVTQQLGIDHLGAGMPSLADVDSDGDLDLMIGQSFNRFPKELRRQAAIASGALAPDSPSDAPPERRARLFLNDSTEGRDSIVLHLQGAPELGSSRDATGAIVTLTADLDGESATPSVTQRRQIHGPAGHAGKQSSFAIHFGLAEATQADAIVVTWPNAERSQSTFEAVPAGSYRLDQSDGDLEEVTITSAEATNAR